MVFTRWVINSYIHMTRSYHSASDQMMLAINFAMSKHSSDETSWRTKEHGVIGHTQKDNHQITFSRI